MNSSKTCLFLLVLLVVGCVFDVAAEGAENINNTGNVGAVADFLQSTLLPSSEQAIILETIRSAPTDTEWLVVKDGAVYTAVLRPVQKSNRPEIQARFEEMARNTARLRAYALFHLYVTSPERKARYADKDVVTEVLTQGEGRLRTDLMITLFSKEWGFAVSRASEGNLNTLSKAIDEISEPSFDEAYSRVRISQARVNATIAYSKLRESLKEGGYLTNVCSYAKP